MGVATWYIKQSIALKNYWQKDAVYFSGVGASQISGYFFAGAFYDNINLKLRFKSFKCVQVTWLSIYTTAWRTKDVSK